MNHLVASEWCLRLSGQVAVAPIHIAEGDGGRKWRSLAEMESVLAERLSLEPQESHFSSESDSREPQRCVALARA